MVPVTDWYQNNKAAVVSSRFARNSEWRPRPVPGCWTGVGTSTLNGVCCQNDRCVRSIRVNRRARLNPPHPHSPYHCDHAHALDKAQNRHNRSQPEPVMTIDSIMTVALVRIVTFSAVIEALTIVSTILITAISTVVPVVNDFSRCTNHMVAGQARSGLRSEQVERRSPVQQSRWLRRLANSSRLRH